MAVQFVEVDEFPASTRTRKENPYMEDVKTLASKVNDEGFSLQAAKYVVAEADVKAAVTLLQAAGRANEVTVKIAKGEPEKGKVTIWARTRPAIKRARLSTESE